ncbi:MAG: glycosyl transferase family 2 [Candidatus Doudnabacteria bacterium]|nr:glycosyl transferase family 2 [Candidatus Doudnabacteria bacterium]
MKISFVVPAYNEEAYLPRCLESILRETQTTSHLTEIIVVNNASTDTTHSVAESYQGVRVIRESRKGLLFARQAGFDASSGELIANVDADSILTPGWIDTVLSEFAANKKLVALSGPFIYYDLSLLNNVLVRFYYYLGYISYINNRFVLRVGSLLQGGNYIVHRSALEKINGYNLSINFYGEDTDIARRLRPIGGVKFTFKLPMYSSGRRLKKEGLLTMGIKYPINYFWTIFFKKPFHTNYVDVRHEATPIFRTNVRKVFLATTTMWTVCAAILMILFAGALSTATFQELKPTTTRAATHSSFNIFSIQDND